MVKEAFNSTYSFLTLILSVIGTVAVVITFSFATFATKAEIERETEITQREDDRLAQEVVGLRSDIKSMNDKLDRLLIEARRR